MSSPNTDEPITLHQFARNKYLNKINASPFCVKLETFLRMANLTYTNAFGINGHPQTNKSPWIEHKGKSTADSSLIIDYLIEEYNLTIDEGLTEQDRSQMLMVKRMLEEHLYWIMVNDNWSTNWDVSSKGFFGNSWFLYNVVSPFVQSSVIKTIAASGVSLHPLEVTERMGMDDMDALNTFLADEDGSTKAYAMGGRLSSLDACVYGFLDTMIGDVLPNSRLVQHANSLPHLVAYHAKLRDEFWPDRDEILGRSKVEEEEEEKES